MSTPYREDPPPGKMPRWFYWSPAHWRRWQVIGVALLGLGALGRRAGCFVPDSLDVPVKITTEHGLSGWKFTTTGKVETTEKAGKLCPSGWLEDEYEVRAWHVRDIVVIECRDRRDGL